ncbi:MAG: hypothetical protein K6T88_20710 [Bacillus sp. (in: Bacteria)]|nr:hypothetical protein [Bacillus sp. (in: firmicutes)]
MKDGKYYITNMDRIFPYLDIRIAQTIPHHSEEELVVQLKLQFFRLHFKGQFVVVLLPMLSHQAHLRYR